MQGLGFSVYSNVLGRSLSSLTFSLIQFGTRKLAGGKSEAEATEKRGSQGDFVLRDIWLSGLFLDTQLCSNSTNLGISGIPTNPTDDFGGRWSWA